MSGLQLVTPPLLLILVFYGVFCALLILGAFFFRQYGGMTRLWRSFFWIIFAVLVSLVVWVLLYQRLLSRTTISLPIAAQPTQTQGITQRVPSLSLPPSGMRTELSSGSALLPPTGSVSLTPLPSQRILSPAASVPTTASAPAVVIMPKLPLAGTTEITILSALVGIITVVGGLLL